MLLIIISYLLKANTLYTSHTLWKIKPKEECRLLSESFRTVKACIVSAWNHTNYTQPYKIIDYCFIKVFLHNGKMSHFHFRCEAKHLSCTNTKPKIWDLFYHQKYSYRRNLHGCLAFGFCYVWYLIKSESLRQKAIHWTRGPVKSSPNTKYTKMLPWRGRGLAR